MSPNDSTIARFAGEIHGQRVLSFRGPLTLQNLASFQTALQVEEAPTVIIDFAEVPYVDSAGLDQSSGLTYPGTKQESR